MGLCISCGVCDLGRAAVVGLLLEVFCMVCLGLCIVGL